MDWIGVGVTTLIIFVLLAFSAFFSGSETALTAASRARMHRLASSGHPKATLVEQLTRERERLIGAVLLGNNLVNILASSLATSMLITLFGDTGVVYATLLMTMLVVIFAEIMPKTYAITKTDATALSVAPVIRWVVYLFAPLTTLLQFVARQTLKIFGVNIDTHTNMLPAHEEIRGAIDLHHKEGSVVKHDRDMLGGILDLADLEVGEIMIHRKNIVMIDIDEKPEEIINQVLSSPHTRIPLWREDPENIVGILHAKDLLRALARPGAGPGSIDFSVLVKKPWFVPNTSPAQFQLNAFLRKKNHFALVVDEYGALMGLVTLEDILEEIVGDIADEHDISHADIRPKPDGSVLVNGTVTIRDLNRTMDWTLPDEEATTIAGLVIHESQTIPDAGQAFSFHGFKFEIVRKQRNQIIALRLKPLRPAQKA